MGKNPLKDDQGRSEPPGGNNGFLSQFMGRVTPCTPVGVGAVLGAITAMELFIIWYMIYLPTGWSLSVYLLAIPAVLLSAYFIILIFTLFATIIEEYSLQAIGAIIGTFAAFILVSSLLLGLSLYRSVVLSILLIPLPALFGAALGNLLQKDFKKEKPLKKVASVVILIVTFSLNLLLVAWLTGAGRGFIISHVF